MYAGLFKILFLAKRKPPSITGSRPGTTLYPIFTNLIANLEGKKSGYEGFFHFMLRPLCVPRLLSTVILPSNRSKDSSFGLSRNSRTREKDKNKAWSYRIRSRVKVTSQVAFSGLAVHSLPFLLLTSVYDPSLPVSALWPGLFCLISYSQEKGIH